MINKEKYKRLTERRGSLVIDKCGNCLNVSNPGGCTAETCRKIVQNRLAELEDKIENGTLFELPCKVGDKVWWVNEFALIPRIEEYEVSTITIGKDNKIYLGVGFTFFTFKIDEVYYTKDQAEARLKELKGE